jgi:hypothetical protein
MKLLLFSCLCLLASCFKPNHPTFQSIYPLKPQSTYVDFLDSNGRFESRRVTDYYVVYGNVGDTLYLSALLKEFAANHFDQSQLRTPTHYEMRFYRAFGVTKHNTSEIEQDPVNYKSEDCIASVFYHPDGHHEVVFQHEAKP